MAVFSVSAPDDLLADADRAAKEAGFAGRSDLVRAALRDFLSARKAERVKGARGCASVTVAYAAGHERRVAAVRHEFDDIVTSALHSHTPGEACVEVLLVAGEVARIRGLVAGLRGVREVRSVAVAYV